MTKTAFITGGTSGIGKAIIATLKANNWRVIAPTRQELDLSNLSALAEYAKKVASGLGNIDAFIHIAGIWHNEDEVLANKDFGSFSSDQIIESMNVGVTSSMVLVNDFRSIMKNSTVIGISGTFNSGAKGWLPYYVSKRALEDFLVGLSQDDVGLKVYGISPADTATEAFNKFYPEYFDEVQSPDEVAKLVMSLLDGNNDFSSGDVIELRGGETKIAFHS